MKFSTDLLEIFEELIDTANKFGAQRVIAETFYCRLVVFAEEIS